MRINPILPAFGVRHFLDAGSTKNARRLHKGFENYLGESGVLGSVSRKGSTVVLDMDGGLKSDQIHLKNGIQHARAYSGADPELITNE